MQSGDRQAGFTLVEFLMVIAIVGIMAAFAAPGFQRFREREEAREDITRIAGALREARSLAVKEGVPYLVIFDPSNSGSAVPAPNPDHNPDAVARIVRDANANNREDGGETVREVVRPPNPSSSVSQYVAPGPFPGGALIDTDVLVGTLGVVVNGANFQVDATTGQPAVGFTTRGWAVDVDTPANVGAGAGSFYVTDNDNTVYAASVGPMGQVRVRTYDPSSDTWR